MNKFGQNTDQPAVYFNKLYMKNVRCFKGNHEIDLGNGKGEPSQWTVILGNNNVGKTTILRAIAALGLKKINDEAKIQYKGYDLISFEKYCSINQDIFFIGNELIYKVENKLESILIPNFRNKRREYIFPPPVIEWLAEKKVSCSISKTEVFDAYGYPNPVNKLKELTLLGYGTSRMMIEAQSVQGDNTQGLFDNKTLLSNVEEWLKELYFAANNKNEQAVTRYNQVENILCGGLLPEVSEIRITTIPDKSSFETFPKFLTSQGWVRLEDLGYGYQATLAWVADLAKRMFDQYPDLENPLHGPAVVLVDEIDLHLHPEWQRKIIKYLSDLFPNTQFIVTAHSPLIIQSAENVNLIMLEKDDNPDGKGINIRQCFGSFQGWTVDEILTELMNLGNRTRSDLYLQLMQDFEDAVLDDDYEKAQNTYNQLDTILSPSSYQRKVLQIQMSSLIPVGV
jgi:AAA15 family ATPase/GTPase